MYDENTFFRDDPPKTTTNFMDYDSICEDSYSYAGMLESGPASCFKCIKWNEYPEKTSCRVKNCLSDEILQPNGVCKKCPPFHLPLLDGSTSQQRMCIR